MNREYARKAALYMRSAVVGTTDPCVEQRERLARMAESLGMEVVGEYADTGCLGLPSGNRPQFQKMLTDAKAGLFGHLLVRDLSRFSRGPNLWTSIAELQRLGVSVCTADGFIIKPQDNVISS